MVWMKLANRARAAITAEPMAKPLVTALVVLPTASRLVMIRSGSPENSPLISAMPAALSDTGPNVSSVTTIPVVASSPIPLRATRYRVNWMFPPPMPMSTPMAMTSAIRAVTDDSRPVLIPDRIVVAGPVRAASAISRTGDVSVEV